MKTKLFSLSPRILIGSYIIIVIIVIIYGFFSYKSNVEERYQQVIRELSILSDSKVKRVQSWRNERYGDAGVMMENSSLILAYKNWLRNPENDDLKNAVVKMVLSYERYFNYKNLILFDKNRAVRLSLDSTIASLDSTLLSNVNISILSKNPSISNLFIADSDSSIYLDVAAPFFSDNELIGGVILRIDPNEFLFPEINNWPVISRTTESILFTVVENTVVFLNNFRFKDNTALKYKIKINDENEYITSVKAAKGLRGFSEGIDYKNSRTLNDIRQIEGSPWILINKIDVDEIYTPIKERIWNQVFFSAFILFIFGAGLLWLWHNRKKSLQIQKLEEEKRILGIAKNYEKVMKYANVAMILSDNDLIIRDVNERALSLYGFTRSEIIGMKIKDFVVSEAEQIPDGNKEEEDKLKEGIIYESLQKRKDNSTFYADINLSIVEINGRNYYHRIISDITQRKIAAEKLRQSKEHLQEINLEKDKFFSIIAHDLREPLGSFMNVTKMMDERKSSMSEDEIDEFVKLMKESSANLYGLLENLLEWSTMKRGLIAVEPKLINLKECLKKNLELLKESAVRKNLKFSSDIRDDLEVFVDERMLNGIIRNLGTNAVKFTPKEGNIIVKAEQTDGNKVLISISDSGIGIPDNIIENLFNSSVNTKRTGTDGEPSSGLGLLLCEEFTEKLGGELIIDSEVGKGSTFKIILPGTENEPITIAEKTNNIISDTIFESE
ncbi:MAG: PAS domain-containing sensor histidine kinase [Ignavibacteria bacterium]